MKSLGKKAKKIKMSRFESLGYYLGKDLQIRQRFYVLY
jgi:hypothetical protein